jgi:hypothetical protein
MTDHYGKAPNRMTVTVRLAVHVRARTAPYAITVATRRLRPAMSLLGPAPARGAATATAIAPAVWRVACRRAWPVRFAGYHRRTDAVRAARALVHHELAATLTRRSHR